MTAATRDQATKALKPLFATFPVEKNSTMGAAATYLLAVEGASVAAIEMAVLRFVRGEVDEVDGRYLPTPPQVGRLVRHCERLVTPLAKPKLLNPPIEERDESPEACAARRAVVERMIEERFPKPKPEPLQPIVDPIEWKLSVMADLAKYRLSDEARATLDPDHKFGVSDAERADRDERERQANWKG